MNINPDVQLNRSQSLFNDYSGSSFSFDELPALAQKYIIDYTYTYGDCDLDTVYGRIYGLVHIPMDVLISEIMKDDEIVGNYGSFEEYHEWYISGSEIEDYKEQWPVFLSEDDTETLYDGWHRFHAYYRQGRESVPALIVIKQPESQ